MGPGRKLGIPGRLIIEEKQFLTDLNDLVLRWGCPMARGGRVDSPRLSAVRIKDTNLILMKKEGFVSCCDLAAPYM